MRQRQWRAKKKSTKTISENASTSIEKGKDINESFKSPQSLGKAVRKVNKSLPKSPSKVPHVIAKVVQQMSPRKRKSILEICDHLVKRRKLDNETRKRRSDAISDVNVKLIEEFYMSDDISRMCPGRKDYITVKIDGGKEHRQKRLLLYNISEVYELFKRESIFQVGLSKFASLRPLNVQPITLYDHEVCVCKYHENITLLLDGLHNVLPLAHTKPEDLLLSTVCDVQDPKCMDRLCSKCEVKKAVQELFQFDDNKHVSYYQWYTSDDSRTRKERKECIAADCKQDLIAQLQPFGRHVYNVKRQYNELRYLKENLPQGEVIIQEDFAENFQIKHQQEIMAAHWSNDVVTLFPAVVYYKSERGHLQHASYAIVSNETAHDKGSVYAFNAAILEDVKQIIEVQKVNYWSDGPSSQFKNRYNFSCILYHQQDLGCDATWNFFETAHGKGPCDGVGAEVKRSVWRSILRNAEVVNSPEDVFQAAKRVCKNINVLYVSEKQIKNIANNLKERWASCQPIPQTHSIHYVAKPSNFILISAKNSQFFLKDGHKEHNLMTTSERLYKGQTSPQPVEQGQNQTNTSVKIELSVPPHLSSKLSAASHSFMVPLHTMSLVKGILDGHIKFKGKGIISPRDLASLNGGYAEAEENYLTNFVLDAYLDLVKAKQNVSGVTVLSWEIFEKFVTKKLLSDENLLKQDIILVPCNTAQTEHWFLLVVLPQEKLMTVLDSMASTFIKPAAQVAVQ